ncbi:MAG: hypothetical protein P9L88_01060 [Candidatus Tantalella remota]|nr:hypothetical protein [Candidatus Tantalella remota]
MRHKRLILLFAGILTMIAAIIYIVGVIRTPVTVEVSARPRAIHIGDSIKYAIVVRAPRGAEISMPDVGEKIGDFTVRGQKTSLKRSLRKRAIVKECILTVYSPGEYRIPQETIKYRASADAAWREIKTKTLPVLVKKLLKEDLQANRRITMGGGMSAAGVHGDALSSGAASRGRSIAAPIRFQINDEDGPRDVITYKDAGIYMLYAAGAVVLLVFVVIFFVSALVYASRKKEPRPSKIADGKFKKLKNQKFSSDDRVGEFCSEAYNIMMEYLQKRFDMPQVVMTPDELVGEIKNISGIDDAQRTFLVGRIELWEHVKYAGGSPVEEIDVSFTEELKFVKATARKDDPEGEKE